MRYVNYLVNSKRAELSQSSMCSSQCELTHVLGQTCLVYCCVLEKHIFF